MASAGSKRPQVSSLPPRKINVHKFAEARASELEALHSIVSSRLNNNFRSLRNKRRRTTAHDNKLAKKRNIKRQKSGVDNKDSASGSKEEQKKIPRRVRRRMELRKNLETGFSASGDGTKRLRTHVWHAKRFAMKKLWGFHLPLGLQGRGRGSRALLKWFKEGVVLHDASYHTAVQLEGPEDSLLSVLDMVLVPSSTSHSEDFSRSLRSGSIYGKAMLHHVGAPHSQSVAPVTYMWKPLQEQQREGDIDCHNAIECNGPHSIEGQPLSRQLWLWIHASAYEEGYDALKLACHKQINETGILINCFSRDGQVAQLEVSGSKAFQLLQKTLHPVIGNLENSWQLKKCSVLEANDESQNKKAAALENEENISSSAVISLTVEDPRTLCDRKIANSPKSVTTTINDNVAEDVVKKHVAFSGASDESKDLSSLSKSDFGGSTFTEQSLWDASNEMKQPVEENVLCMEKHLQRIDLFCLHEPKSGTRNTSNKVQCSRSCPILLVKNTNRNCSPMGWTVILPLSWVRVFWISFVSKGAHVIGLREKRWIAGEMGLAYFPSDFPDCKAYSSFMAIEAAEHDQKAERRPPAMRSFKIPIPPPWNVVCASLNKASVGERDSQFSSDKNMVSESGDPFEGMVVARTSIEMSDFLKDIHCDNLPLFPRFPNQKSTLTKSMSNYSKLGQGQGFTHVNYDHKLCFLRVLLRAYKEGVFEEGAVVCAPCLSDISLWTSSSGGNEGGLEMPQSYVRSYFKQLSFGNWELQLPEDPATMESHRWPIGFVTTGFVRGSKKPTAEALCEAVLLGRLREEQWKSIKRRRKEIYVLVRNLRSSAYRLALATIVLEQQQDDVDFM